MKCKANIQQIALMVLVAAFCVSTFGFPAPKSHSPAEVASSGAMHSADTYLYLFNTKAYRKKVYPAYQAFRQKNDLKLLFGLLQEAQQMIEKYPKLSDEIIWDSESYEKAVAILEGKIEYQSNAYRHSGKKEISPKEKKLDYIRFELGDTLLQAFCLPRDKGVNPEQNVSGVSLIHYLYKHSKWMDEFFDGTGHTHGGELEIAMGGCIPEVFLKKDVQTFEAELSKIPPPDEPYLRKDYDNLRAIVRLALTDPDLTLLLAVI